MRIPKTTRPADDPRNGPVVMRQDLLAHGYTDDAIKRMLRRGELLRIREGAFVPPTVWAQLDEVGRHGLLSRAVLRQAQAPMVISHVSGLVEYDVPTWGFDLSRAHVTRTDGLRGRRGRDVHVHSGLLHAGDLEVVNEVPVMNPARVALETLTAGRPEATFCVLNHMLHTGLVTKNDLACQLVAMQTWRNMLPAEVLLRLATPLIESVGEGRTLWACWQQRLPMPVAQYEIRDRSGRLLARLDFAWPEHGVYLEFDGRVKYEKLLRPGQSASDVVFAEKRREDLVRELTGWICLRITWADLADPVRLAARIRAAFARRAA